ncbi:unnamed protein product, partial [Brachionus calyciflorus]
MILSIIFMSMVLNYDFGKTFQSYEIVFGYSNTIWLIAIDHNNKYVYLSNDNGASFNRYEKVTHVDNIFLSDHHHQIILFNDVNDNKIHLSKDNGKKFISIDLDFRPDFLSFNYDESIILAVETRENNLNKAWLSFNFGINWTSIGDNLPKVPVWKDKTQFLYFI